MAYSKYMQGYNEDRTIYQLDSLYKWQKDEIFPPVILEVSPVGGCNQKCVFCYSDEIDTKKDRFSEQLLVDTFINMGQFGVKSILLQGTGEPLLHKGIARSVKAGFESGLTFSLTTNGVLLTPKLQDKMLQYFTFIKFSVLDNEPIRYAYRHGAPDTDLTSVNENISYANKLRKEKNIDVALVGTVYVELDNFKEIPNIVKFFKELGLDYIVVQEATYTEYTPANQSKNTSEHCSKEDIEKMKIDVYNLNDDDFEVKVRFPINDETNHEGMDCNTWKPNFCHGTKFFPIIGPDADIYPCFRGWGKDEFSFGNLNDNSFEDIWRSQKRKKIENVILMTPPIGDECQICGVSKLNDKLEKYNQTNKWRNFLI